MQTNEVVSAKALILCEWKVVSFVVKIQEKLIRMLPGWKVDTWETIEQALKRELKEELNFELLELHNPLYIWEYSYIRMKDWRKSINKTFTFAITREERKKFDTTKNIDSSEIDILQYVDDSTIDTLEQSEIRFSSKEVYALLSSIN
jgi:ADP-ribose pyrophosphatase YjhB (NUDIX family)